MSQDEHPTEVRTCTTQGENKGRKQQRARAPLRQPSATAPTRRDTPKGSETKSPFCVVLKTYHLTGNHRETCLKHSNFLNRKLCPIVTNMEHHGNSKGTGNRRKNKIRQNELRQGSKHGNYNMPPRLIGRDPEVRPVHQISRFHFTHGICLILPGLQILERAQTRRLPH